MRFVLLLALAVLPFACSQQAQDKPEQQPAVTEKPQEGLPELALFLGGKHPEDTTRLGKLVKTPQYKAYKAKISEIWQTYSKDFSVPLAEWRDQNVPIIKSNVIFYPFAGPDFPNANTLYPGGQTYIMVGLEPAGKVPDFASMADRRVLEDLNRIVASVDYVARRTYFITSFMNSSYISSDGVGPILLVYLAMLDYVPYSMKPVDVDEEGRIRYLTAEDLAQYKKDKRAHSIEIRFQAAVGQPLKTIYYFKKDVENPALKKDPRLLKFLEGIPRFASVFKAASYLPHYESFSAVTGVVLDRSEVIVMDDTGPMLNKLDNFDVRVYGHYGRPIYPFQRSYQPDLAALFREEKPAPLKFRYGYGAADGSRGILLAMRRPPAESVPEKQ